MSYRKPTAATKGKIAEAKKARADRVKKKYAGVKARYNPAFGKTVWSAGTLAEPRRHLVLDSMGREVFVGDEVYNLGWSRIFSIIGDTLLVEFGTGETRISASKCVTRPYDAKRSHLEQLERDLRFERERVWTLAQSLHNEKELHSKTIAVVERQWNTIDKINVAHSDKRVRLDTEWRAAAGKAVGYVDMIRAEAEKLPDGETKKLIQILANRVMDVDFPRQGFLNTVVGSAAAIGLAALMAMNTPALSVYMGSKGQK